jgi:hypothetical protein
VTDIRTIDGIVKIDGSTIRTVNTTVLTVGEIPLTRLLQSSATTGQAIVWNGSAWAPGSASGNSLVVDLTTAGDSFTATAVTGQTWVASGTELVATLADHPSGASAEEAAAEGAVVTVGAIVAGTGFTVYLNVPGGGIGPYRASIVGV